MFRTGFRNGFLSVKTGKNQKRTGVRGLSVPGMKYTICCVYVFYFCFSLNKNGRFEQQSIQLNSHFKYRILTLYWYKESVLYGRDFSL